VLTKDLIKCRIQAGKLKPQFIKPDDIDSMELARDLISKFSALSGETKKDVDSFLSESFDSSDIEFLGLKKIVTDHCSWKEDDDKIAEMRWLWLKESQKLRDTLEFGSIQEYQNSVAAHLDRDFSDLSQSLFADLPENRILINSGELQPDELISRYNTAVVQGLLLKAHSMRLKIKNIAILEKRQLFRNLKFHQMMVSPAETNTESKNGDIDILIDGPLNLFQKSSVYGMKFANFFPHILNLKKWELIADLEWKKKDRQLKLTDKNGLVSHYEEKSGYIPKEFDGFVSFFNKTNSDWTAKIGENFLKVGAQSFCFPDFEFEKSNGKSVVLELFHKWHQGQLLERLSAIEKDQNNTVIIGVCRKIAKQKDVAKILDNSKVFQQNGLLFSDFPTPNGVKKVLTRIDS